MEEGGGRFLQKIRGLFSRNGSRPQVPPVTAPNLSQETPIEPKPATPDWPAGEAHEPPFVPGSIPGTESWAPGKGMIATEKAQEIREELKNTKTFPAPEGQNPKEPTPTLVDPGPSNS